MLLSKHESSGFNRHSLGSAFIALRQCAGELAPGEQRAGLRCPFCGGGSHRESSLSLTRANEVEALYYCHRASCGRSGRVACWGFRLPAEPNEMGDSTEPLKPPRKLYTGTPKELGEQWSAYLVQRFGLSKEETDWAGWQEDTNSGDLNCPIFDSKAVRIGTHTRKFPQSGNALAPKARTYFTGLNGGPAWFQRHGNLSPIVVVEDVISALKVSRHFTAVALLGTHLSTESLLSISSTRAEIILALDKDATNKAFGYQKKYGLYAPIKVAVLERDLKVCDDEEILERISKAVG